MSWKPTDVKAPNAKAAAKALASHTAVKSTATPLQSIVPTIVSTPGNVSPVAPQRRGTPITNARARATATTLSARPKGPVQPLIAPQAALATVVPASIDPENVESWQRRGRGEGPDPVDLHVGGRLRERRVALGLSQSALAERLDLTFQQVQKYERGANRLSASTLLRAAEAVDVPVSYFFDGLPRAPKQDAPPVPGNATLTILRRIAELDPAARTKILQLLAMLDEGN